MPAAWEVLDADARGQRRRHGPVEEPWEERTLEVDERRVVVEDWRRAASRTESDCPDESATSRRLLGWSKSIGRGVGHHSFQTFDEPPSTRIECTFQCSAAKCP